MTIPNANANPAEMQEIPIKSIGTGDKSDATFVKTPVITASETGIANMPADNNAIETNIKI